MVVCRNFVRLSLAVFAAAAGGKTQTLPREEWGAPAVDVTREGNTWVAAGRKNRVVFNPSDLSLTVDAEGVSWSFVASEPDDMLVKSRGEEFFVRLADVGKIDIEPYDTGYCTGMKATLERFRDAGIAARGVELDLSVYLTMCLEGREEELVFGVAAREGEAVVRQLDWPKPLDAAHVDYTVLSNRRGTLLARNWPREYTPIRAANAEGVIDPKDTSAIQSNLIECWSMSWWGFQKGQAAMMLLVETPNDASYKFRHPPGGPTVIGPRWRASLGRFRYPRAVRMAFFADGNYVTLAKLYRRHVMDSGQFVSLKQKIAREPLVAKLLGTPHIRLHVLKNVRKGAHRYDRKDPEKNYQLTTFDERASQLRELKRRGLDRLYVCLAGWPYLGYDRQHPDGMPPAPDAGGWDGMKRFAAALWELDYLFVPHEQYRDYYTDAPSYQRQFAVHDEDQFRANTRFPATRFGVLWKDGYIPFMDYWEGGEQTYLNPRFMLGHLKKNFKLLFEHGIHPEGAYLDVFGYVPPDEDFNPEHPATRTDCLEQRAACFRWVRNNLGLVGTEAAADWVIPYVDFGSANPGQGTAIPVPLYELVYHDAIVLPYASGTAKDALVGLLHGGVPQIWGRESISDETLARAKRMAALHARLGLLEMTNHEFLDERFRRERTAFAGGTTVTVDHDAGTIEIQPEL